MPRSGKVNGNKDKFLKEDIEYIYTQGKDLITKFGYDSMFTGKPQEDSTKYIDDHNTESLKQAISSNELKVLQLNDQSYCIRRSTE